MNYALIQDLLDHPKIMETRQHMHHNVPKHDHLLRSAHFCYWLAPLLGANQRLSVRAAMLHDIDSREGTLTTHGTIAAKYAAHIGEPDVVCVAIRSHMYPFGPSPKNREGWVLVIADKMATVTDLLLFIGGLVVGNSLQQRRQLEQSDPFYRALIWNRKKNMWWRWAWVIGCW